jgi:hypothetical protein
VAHDLEATHARQPPVHDDHGVVGEAEQRQRILGGCGTVDEVAVRLEAALEDLAQARFVLDHQQTHSIRSLRWGGRRQPRSATCALDYARRSRLLHFAEARQPRNVAHHIEVDQRHGFILGQAGTLGCQSVESVAAQGCERLFAKRPRQE